MKPNPETECETERKRKVTVRTYDFGATKPGVNLNKLNQLADELAVEDYLRKAARDQSGGNRPTG